MKQENRRHPKNWLLPWALCTGLCLLWAGCANQLPPEGGPVDMTPPKIIEAYPDSSSLYYSNHVIKFTFDRYIDEGLFEESIFISPSVGILEFNWSGTEVEITFSEPLRNNTTYVVNIGTDVKDRYRGQTRMANAYSLAFSTGHEIDRGGIEGYVFPVRKKDPAFGIMIFAYTLDGIKSDTLDPTSAAPDYITQTGKDGSFFLRHLPFGSYRVIAVRDEYRNLLYDRETDEYGVPSGSIRIGPEDTLQKNILLQLTREDTTAPFVTKAEAVDQNHVQIEFSTPILSSSVTSASLRITDTLGLKQIEILAAYPDPVKQRNIILLTQKQDSGAIYLLTVKNAVDSAGNKINPLADSYYFQGSAKKDTVQFHLSAVSVKDSTRGVDLKPSFQVIFSDAADRKTAANAFRIRTAQNRIIPSVTVWENDIRVSVTPVQPMESGQWYILHADLPTIQNWASSACIDSAREWHFETFDIEDMSSVDGNITDTDSIDRNGILYVTAHQIDGSLSRRYTASADSAGNYVFPVVAEGRYIFQAFRDRNNNGIYDAGKLFPYQPSERISMYSDTVRVRARWPLEGLRMVIH